MATDYPALRSEQFSNAAATLGLTNVNRGKGQENLFWPNLTGAFAVKVIDYWIAESSRVQGHVASIPDSAIRTQWMRAVEILRSQRGLALQAAPHQLLPAAQAALIWTSVDGVALPLRALNDTPTKWQFFAESVEEAVREVGAGTRNVLYIVLAALALVLVVKAS